MLDVLTGDGKRALYALFEECLSSLQADILRVNLENPEEERKLLFAKLRHEGAAKLLWAVKAQLEALTDRHDA